MINDLKAKYGANTAKLALTYLAIIMSMSFVFSIVLYNTSVSQLNRPLPGGRSGERQKPYGGRGMNEPAFSDEAKEILNERFEEAKEALLIRLILINLLILGGGVLFSFYLARKTLEPIELAMESQTRFVSDASHELRTPLTVIQTTNEVALRKQNISDNEARKILQQNIEEVDRLKNLSDSLLSLLKNQNQNIELKPTNLLDITTESIETIVTKAQLKKIKIVNKVSNIVVKTDLTSAVRILTIFIDNAIKYSPNGSQIVVSSKKVDGKHNVLVTDKGAGIKESDIPHIFDRFYRSDSSRGNNQDIDGYGLGLSIAKQTAINIRADITVKSTLGKGSVFSIVFPS
jgi:two-component system sensor histidine kinase CiaH